MHVAISGTHGSGKSTLMSDFAMSHREWTVLPDPYEYTDLAEEASSAVAFGQQLNVAARRLSEPAVGPQLAERSPLDFLAYLHALDALGRPGDPADLFELNYWTASRAMTKVDLLVLLPLHARDGIEIGPDEDLELREVMNESLLELADDTDLVGAVPVVEIVGSRESRLMQLEAAINEL